MSDAGAILLEEVNFLLASYGALQVGVVDGTTSVAQMTALGGQLRAVGSRPGGFALLFVIRDGALLPSSEVRARFEATMRAQTGKLKLLAAVIEGSGFATATKRSVFTMIVSTFLGPINVKTFSDTPKACAWLTVEAPRVGLGLPPPAALAAFVRSLPDTRPA